MNGEQIKHSPDESTLSSVVFEVPWVQEEMKKRMALAMRGSKK